ncbi:ComF family protein [Brevibacillus sp. H7]|uniref:ComF family protein n=1 Tax=Brevibacillus sp. H7 TaxID=3349138 RepID=UPI0037F5E515
MPVDVCMACGQHLGSVNRERVIRLIAKRLSQPSTYPVVFRCAEQLRLCGRCLEQLPLIGEVICSSCGRALLTPSRCGDCQAVAGDPLSANRSLLLYNEWGKQLLGRFKYRGDERLAEFFARLLAVAYYRYYYGQRIQLITYVPLHPVRLTERGFNQVELVAVRLGRILRLPVRPLLTRVKQTDKLSQQTGRASRRESMRGAFAFSPPPDPIRPTHIVIIDDIYTTGSTLRSCAAAIQAAQPCQIYGLTIYR